MANELIIYPEELFKANGYGESYLSCGVGNNIFNLGEGSTDGAIRFTNVQIGQGATLNFCKLVYPYSTVGGGSGTWAFKVRGVDEDNTASVTSGNPLGRTQTSAEINVSEGPPTTGGTREFDLASIVQEIVGRAGWASGNALCITFQNNSSSDQVGATTLDPYLAYRINAEPNFKPTPTSVSAPSLPAAGNWGIKISFPGQSVLTATEAQLYYTSRRKQFKVLTENAFTSSAVGDTTINHALDYVPFCEVFVSEPAQSQWYSLPKAAYFEDHPYFTIDSNNLIIHAPDSGYKFYYYIYLDQLL